MSAKCINCEFIKQNKRIDYVFCSKNIKSFNSGLIDGPANCILWREEKKMELVERNEELNAEAVISEMEIKKPRKYTKTASFWKNKRTDVEPKPDIEPNPDIEPKHGIGENGIYIQANDLPDLIVKLRRINIIDFLGHNLCKINI